MTIQFNKIVAENESLTRAFHEFTIADEVELAAAQEFLNALANQFEALRENSSNSYTTLSEVAYKHHTEGVTGVEIFSNSSIPFNLVMYGVYKYLYNNNFKQDFDQDFNIEITHLFEKLHECYINDNTIDYQVKVAMEIAFKRLNKPLNPKTLVMNYLYIITQRAASDEWFTILRYSDNKVNDFADLVEEWFTNHPTY